jgi:transcription elongation factor GreA-like protein
VGPETGTQEQHAIRTTDAAESVRHLLRSVRDVVTLVDLHRDEEALSYFDVVVRNAVADLDREFVDSVICRLQALISEYGLDKETGDGPVIVTYRPDCHAWLLQDRAIGVHCRAVTTAHNVLRLWPR